jgi:hypothetical protein
MPYAQTLFGSFNARFRSDKLDDVPAELFEPGRSLSDATRELGGDRFGMAGYIERLPPAIHDAIRAAIHSALSRSPRSAITFAWAPGYDYELGIWDVPATSTSPGGITLLVRTRYPDDRHPLGGQ